MKTSSYIASEFKKVILHDTFNVLTPLSSFKEKKIDCIVKESYHNRKYHFTRQLLIYIMDFTKKKKISIHKYKKNVL